MDWSRVERTPDEKRLISRCQLTLLQFFADFKDPVVWSRYDTHAKRLNLRSTITPIVLSVHDTLDTEEVINLSSSTVPQEFLERHGIDWSDIHSVVIALSMPDVDAIALEVWEGDSVNGISASELIRNPPPPVRRRSVKRQPVKAAALLQSHPKLTEPPSANSTIIPDDTKVAKAKALQHSRPLDVHTWSDHREVNTFVNDIYKNHFNSGNAKIQKKHIKVILLDLYVAWCEDPTLKIGFSRDVDAYKPNTRYNKLKISKKAIEVVDRLKAVGLINLAPGKFDKDTRKSFTSRIWPTAALIEMFKVAKYGPLDIDMHHQKECIILRDIVTRKRKKRGSTQETDEEVQVDVPYEDTPDTIRMREQLTEYNNLLRRTFIDIPSLEKPFIDLGGKRGRERYLSVSQRDKFVRRIFNRGSFEYGGRFWGGWWQGCPKEWRKQIHIDDNPTCEIDYSGLHVVMLYAREGHDYWHLVNSLPPDQQDPYTLPASLLNLDKVKLREVCKSLVLVALNAKNEKSAFAAFRRKIEKGDYRKRLTNKQLKTVLDALKEKHSVIAHQFASDVGISLMRKDSEITSIIIDYFTKKNVPILSLHDSYIIQEGYERDLEGVMKKAFNQVMKVSSGRSKRGKLPFFIFPKIDVYSKLGRSVVYVQSQKGTERYRRELVQHQKHFCVANEAVTMKGAKSVIRAVQRLHPKVPI